MYLHVFYTRECMWPREHNLNIYLFIYLGSLQEAERFIDMRPRRYKYEEGNVFHEPTVVANLQLSSSDEEDDEVVHRGMATNPQPTIPLSNHRRKMKTLKTMKKVFVLRNPNRQQYQRLYFYLKKSVRTFPRSL